VALDSYAGITVYLGTKNRTQVHSEVLQADCEYASSDEYSSVKYGCLTLSGSVQPGLLSYGVNKPYRGEIETGMWKLHGYFDYNLHEPGPGHLEVGTRVFCLLIVVNHQNLPGFLVMRCIDEASQKYERIRYAEDSAAAGAQGLWTKVVSIINII
jgi:hypothetical protein